MSKRHDFLDGIVKAALAELRAHPMQIYTFALYHDQESSAVSVCLDTRESSLAFVRESNAWGMKYFAEHIRNGSLHDASLFQANVGRSLSLGDYARVNVARTDLPPGVVTDESFYLAMARAVIANQLEILTFAASPEEVIFCCSSADSEVGLAWSALPDAEQTAAADGEDAAAEP